MPRRFSSPKGPDDIAEYTFDFSSLLSDGDTIVAVDDVIVMLSPDSDVVPSLGRADLMMDTALFGPSLASVWLTGGIVGATYRIALSIQTASGRTLRRSADLEIADL